MALSVHYLSKILVLTYYTPYSRFQALLKTFEQLSGLILDTIRIDIRCRTMFYLNSSMRYVRFEL